MITYIFDGTKNGLFTCIFESFYAREIPDDVSNEACQTGLFDINKTIMTDKEKAERVCASLRKCRTVNILSDVAYAFRSGEKTDSPLFLIISEKPWNIKTTIYPRRFPCQNRWLFRP